MDKTEGNRDANEIATMLVIHYTTGWLTGRASD